MFKRYKYPLGPPFAPVDLVPFLTHRLGSFQQEIGVGNVVAFVVFQGGGLYFLNPVADLHLLPQLVETLEIKHTFAQRLYHVTSLENIGSGSFLSIKLNIDIPVEDQ